MNDLDRDAVLAELNTSSDQIFPARFFRQKRTNKAVKGPYEYHNLVRGIYKPSGCDLAISIRQTLTGPYQDALNYKSPSNWSLDYVQQAKGASGWDNLALERCVERAPVGVIVQESSKASRPGSRYKVWGLGKVNAYDKKTGIFNISCWQGALRTRRTKVLERDISAQDKLLRKLLARPFKPFEETRPPSLVKRRAREAAFRLYVMMVFDGTCGACGNKWMVNGRFESQAAHIIPKSEKGTDDPRNGIALCLFHHWAFDRGLFSINDDYTIVVSPHIIKYSNNSKPMQLLSGAKVILPSAVDVRPSAKSLEWHRNHTFIR